MGKTKLWFFAVALLSVVIFVFSSNAFAVLPLSFDTTAGSPGSAGQQHYYTFTASAEGMPATFATCTYSISPTSQSVSSSGGTESVAITPSSSSCSWTASSNASWITITSNSSGTGNGAVSYSVSANTSTSQQTGTITVAGQTLTIIQSAGSYTLTVTKTGTGTGTVTANSGTISWSGNTGTATYSSGASVILTSTPDSSSTFLGWSGACTGTGTCTVSMTAAKNVTAIYTADCPTSLTIDSITPTIISTQNPNLTIAGKLTDGCPGSTVSLLSLPITLTFTSSDGITTVSPASINTNTSSGGYTYYGTPNLTKNGTYTVSATFAGSTKLGLAGSSSNTATIQMGSSVGYAVIIEGSDNGIGEASHNKTTNRIYNMLKARGFTDANIYYFDFSTSQTGADAIPSKTAIGKVISGADGQFNLSAKLQASPAPIYIFMVDHGAKNAFYLNGTDTISPNDLNGWLNTLESSLAGSPALNEKRVVVIGACYSGSFIPVLTGSGRIIITSATANEVATQGIMEPDGIRSGEFFVEELVKAMGQGQTLKTAFQAAAASTRYYTQWSTMSSTPVSNTPAFADNAIQHPLLDDIGSGVGSNDLSVDKGNGLVSNNVIVGTTPMAQTPGVSIVSVTPTEFLSSGATTQNLAAWVNNTDSNTPLVWIGVRDPGYQITTTTSTTDPTEQLLVLVTYEQMSQVAGISKWQYSQFNFSNSGKYEVYYYAEDPSTNIVTPMQRSVVYKNKSGNHAPNAFSLTSPLSGAQPSVVVFNWNTAADPDGDSVTYTIEIGSDNTFNPNGAFYFKQEELTVNAFSADSSVNLIDGNTYYWRATAIDSYGAQTVSSNTGSFTVSNSTNAGLPQLVVGTVTDSTTGQPISSFTGQVSNGVTIAPVLSTGYYLISSLSVGTYTLTFTAQNYIQYSSTITLTTPGGTYPLDIHMQQTENCTSYSFSAGIEVVGSSGGTGTFSVTATPTGCTSTWTATTSDSWITITSGSSGAGSGSVSYSASANTGTTSRTATITIAGQTVTVTQAGQSNICTNLPVMIAGPTPSYYSSIQSTYNTAFSGETLQSRAGTFTENLNFSSNKWVSLTGGYDCYYSTDISNSVINGTLIISNGTVNLKNIIIQ